MVGFKHDQECLHMTEGQFVVLSRRAPKKGFLGKLLVDDEPAEQRAAGGRWLQWTST